MCFSGHFLCWEPNSDLDPAQMFFLLCGEEEAFWYLTYTAFAEHKLPVLFEGGGKTYAAWDQQSAENKEKALLNKSSGTKSGQCLILLDWFLWCSVPAVL